MKKYIFLLLVSACFVIECKGQSKNMVNDCWEGQYDNLTFLVTFSSDTIFITENRNVKSYKVIKRKGKLTFTYGKDEILVINKNDKRLVFSYLDEKLRENIPVLIDVTFIQCRNKK